MSDNLIVGGLVFVFLDKIGRAGKGNPADVFLDFICGHAKAVVNKFQGLFFRIYNNLNLRFKILRQGILTHHVKLF